MKNADPTKTTPPETNPIIRFTFILSSSIEGVLVVLGSVVVVTGSAVVVVLLLLLLLVVSSSYDKIVPVIAE